AGARLDGARGARRRGGDGVRGGRRRALPLRDARRSARRRRAAPRRPPHRHRGRRPRAEPARVAAGVRRERGRPLAERRRREGRVPRRGGHPARAGGVHRAHRGALRPRARPPRGRPPRLLRRGRSRRRARGGARPRVARRAGLPAGGRARPDRVSRARADDRPRHRALPAARAGVMGYRIGVDVGGTFTDLLLAREGAPSRAAKTPSTPADSSEGFLTGLAALDTLRGAGVEAVAICFMHAWANAAHEQAAEARARAALPAAYLSRSSALLPQVRFTERVSTTVLNAAVGPVLSRYLDRLITRLGAAGFRGVLLVMQSNGGVAAPAVARTAAATTLLSGPAAAPTAALAYLAPHGARDFLTVDMGGTSFDVCLVKDGAPAVTSEGRIARYPFGLPALAIHTIGAGGGSIGWLDDGGLLRMGPKSAGAAPGPACYGRGGTRP